FAADPKVVEVRPASPTSLFLFGVAPGRTTVAALSASGAPIVQWDVVVQPSGYAAGDARSSINRTIPGAGVTTETRPNGIGVSGEVATPAEADRASRLARAYLSEKGVLDNRLAVSTPTQVNLRVRIIEMSRTLTRELGLNWQALGNLGRYGVVGLATANGLADLASSASTITSRYAKTNGAGGFGTDINTTIDALNQDQLIRTLAEPNLTALSGETASFLVGGEFPIPVANTNNTISLEFKQYGISLAFVPTVTSGDRIVLHVRPEVSQLTNQGAVQLGNGNNSISVPGLTVRRADTTVELGSGQSFAIAGLLQDSQKLTGLGLPFLGDVPILGALFRSDSFQQNQTELVIVVTPYIVRPVSNIAAIAQPDDGWRVPNDLERILLLRQSAVGTPAPRVRIPGEAGFVLP
ncbi:MAG: type II and III secretion system protein family protein, partial [Janthinobacterium lividum]